MLPSPFKSRFHLLAGILLGALNCVLPTTALAEGTDSPTLLSMLMPSLAEPASLNADNVLTRHELIPPPQLPNTIDLTAPSDNLWERIRNGFGMTNLNDNLVLHYQQWYQNRPDALRRMVERSRPYLHYIVEELEARGMPTEIALLPMVESSFNPMAYSRAHASGLWQFIPATGKRFKLEQDWWRDDRRDILASTNAALDYLQTIYEMHGDWHLALASYNWGEGAVKRAIEKNEARGLPTDYPSLNMPNETRHYVPKLQALKNIFGNPALLARLDIPIVPNEAYFATLEAGRPVDVKTAARLANMSVDEFVKLNPSHNRPVIRPETALVIPADKVETFRTNLSKHTAPLANWQAYTLTATEKLDQIASRFDTTATELARVNGLSERVRLAAGSTLLVPGAPHGSGLANLLAASAPVQIIAPEPVPCGKKSAKSKSPKPTGPCFRAATLKNSDERTIASTKHPGDKKKAEKGNAHAAPVLASKAPPVGRSQASNKGSNTSSKLAKAPSAPPPPKANTKVAGGKGHRAS